MKNIIQIFSSLIVFFTLKRLFIGLFSIQLFACTSTQIKNDIKENKWQAIGEEHGTSGIKEHSIVQLRALSDKYGTGTVDYPRYQKSYKKGITLYCQPKNAFSLGGSGRKYNGVCDRFPHGSQFKQDWEFGYSMKTAM